VNLLSNLGGDAPKFSPGSFAKFGRTLLRWSYPVIGVDINIANLKEEVQRLAVKRFFQPLESSHLGNQQNKADCQGQTQLDGKRN